MAEKLFKSKGFTLLLYIEENSPSKSTLNNWYPEVYSFSLGSSAILCNSIIVGVPVFLVNRELTNNGVFFMLFCKVSI